MLSGTGTAAIQGAVRGARQGCTRRRHTVSTLCVLGLLCLPAWPAVLPACLRAQPKCVPRYVGARLCAHVAPPCHASPAAGWQSG